MNIKKSVTYKPKRLVFTLSFIGLTIALNACSQGNKSAQNSVTKNADTVVISKAAGALIDSGYKLMYKVGPTQRLDTAIQYFERSITIDSSRFLPFQLWITALEMQGKIKFAVKPLSKWLDANPNDLDARLNRGILYENFGQKDDACKDFAKINQIIQDKTITINTKLNSKEQDSVRYYALIYFLIEKKDAGIGLLAKLENSFPNDEKTKKALAKINSEDRNTVIKQMFNY